MFLWGLLLFEPQAPTQGLEIFKGNGNFPLAHFEPPLLWFKESKITLTPL